MSNYIILNKRLSYEIDILNKVKKPLSIFKKNYDIDYFIGLYREDFNVVIFLDSLFNIIIVNIDFSEGTYPFKRPKVYIGKNKRFSYNDLLSKEYLRLSEKKIVEGIEKYNLAFILEISDILYNKLFNINSCLCCSSILCSSVWSSSYRIIDILKEIYNKHKIIEKLSYMIFAKVIMRKYLNIIIPLIYELI
jgi:hypothetical protein